MLISPGACLVLAPLRPAVLTAGFQQPSKVAEVQPTGAQHQQLQDRPGDPVHAGVVPFGIRDCTNVAWCFAGLYGLSAVLQLLGISLLCVSQCDKQDVSHYHGMLSMP